MPAGRITMTRHDDKAALRARMGAQRAARDAVWVRETSVRVMDRVCALPEFAAARSIGAYLSIAGEVCVDRAMAAAWAGGKAVYVPAFRRDTGVYGWTRLTAATELVRGRLGVREPAKPEWARGEDVDLMLVPAVALDAEGRRLGRGGGYYDRLLADEVRGRISAGVVFDFQVVDAVPVTAGDRPVDMVVTETHVMRRSGTPSE